MARVSYEISFLSEPWDFEGKYFSFKPRPDFEERKARLNKNCISKKIPSPESGHMFKLYASHRLIIDQNLNKDPKPGIAGFVAYLLGMIAGTQLQFSDWWFVRPVPFQKLHGLPIYKPHIPLLIDKAIECYLALPTVKARRALVNSLFLHNNAKNINFAWERFFHYHLVLDALVSVCNNGTSASNLPTKWKKSKLMRQVNALSRDYGIHFKRYGFLDIASGKRLLSTKSALWRIKGLRNTLIHEATWENVMPGASAKSTFSTFAGWYLKSLNEKIIVALILGPNPFSSSDWVARLDPMIRVEKN